MPEKLMSFTDHLEELRRRLKTCFFAVLVCMSVCYYFSDLLFVLMARPLIQAWSEAGLGAPKLHFSNPVEPFFTYLKVSLITGIFVSSPIIFYQLWNFVAPGLYKNEKRYALPFAVVSALLFSGGAAFGYFMVFPLAFKFFLGYAQSDMGRMQELLGGAVNFSMKQVFDLTPTLMIGEYFSLVWKMLLAFGLVFELPLVIFFFSMIGLVNYASLWRFNRYFIILAFVIGAVLTPADPISQVMMAIPLIVLYNLSILLSFMLFRNRGKPAES